jgi:hypothetical protein
MHIFFQFIVMILMRAGAPSAPHEPVVIIVD